MSEETKKKRIPKYDRVTLYEEAMRRVDGWIKQVEETKAGVSLHRKDILNWYVVHASEKLEAKTVEEMAAQFFDQERFLKQAIRRVREAKKRGETLSLQALMSEKPSAKPKRPRKLRGPKDDQSGDVSGDPMMNQMSNSPS